jgi:hypothetical protein
MYRSGTNKRTAAVFVTVLDIVFVTDLVTDLGIVLDAVFVALGLSMYLCYII